MNVYEKWFTFIYTVLICCTIGVMIADSQLQSRRITQLEREVKQLKEVQK